MMQFLMFNNLLFKKKYKRSFILRHHNIFTTDVIRIDAIWSVLSGVIQPYPHQKPVNSLKLRLYEKWYVNSCG